MAHVLSCRVFVNWTGVCYVQSHGPAGLQNHINKLLSLSCVCQASIWRVFLAFRDQNINLVLGNTSLRDKNKERGAERFPKNVDCLQFTIQKV